MAIFNKFNSFVEDIGEEIHNFSTDTLRVALTNTAPVPGNTVLANITEISYTNLSSRTIVTTSYTQTAGLARLILADLVLSATGAVGPFRYVVIYNDTAAGKQLIGWSDYGSSITMASGESFVLNFDNVNGLLTIQ